MSEYAHPEVLVDTQWLADHLHDPNIRVVETDMNQQAYNEGHIPGAIFWNAGELLLPNFRTNFDPGTMAALMARSGITNDTIAIASSSSFPATGAWLFWLLKVFGHPDVRVLNGGEKKWKMTGHTLTTEATNVTPTQYQAQAPNQKLRIVYEEVKESIVRGDRLLVDVRTPLEYNGQLYMSEPPKASERAGHIPGATHVDYEVVLNEDGTFKSVEELQAIYNDKGITSDQEIIPYCAVGARSGHTWFVLKYLLGYGNVRNYDGSWNEWSQGCKI